MKTAIDTSLIGRVSQIGGIGIDGAQISALAVNSATYGVTGPASGASGSSGCRNVQNTYNFYQPVTTPDEVAKEPSGGKQPMDWQVRAHEQDHGKIYPL